MSEDKPRLIERAFPLKQASLDSVHEKNVRHGHISTLHIWPARRPLAASRAALIATLLPDPGSHEDRMRLCERIGGILCEKIEKKKMPSGRTTERIKEFTQGGVLSWIGTAPTSGTKSKKAEHAELVRTREEELQWFRNEIYKANNGSAPKVLDPFAGGGAIPLEAMRLGCEVTSTDINPVAWFIQKCTLEYPNLLVGKSKPLPGFAVDDEIFMESFYKSHPHLVGRTKKTRKQLQREAITPGLFDKPDSGRIPKATFPWHVRAWGAWVQDQIARELSSFYPVYADFEPVDRRNPRPYEPRESMLVPIGPDGLPAESMLNGEFSKAYLADKRNPRYVAKPAVAYLWARTSVCKNCRAVMPLLKTKWLCKKSKKRVLLKMDPNPDKTGVIYGIDIAVPVKGGNSAQRREHDKRIGQATMSRAGVQCPCCDTITSMEDLRLEGQAGRLGAYIFAVVVDGQKGKEYRVSRPEEIAASDVPFEMLDDIFRDIPGGIPDEPLPDKDALGIRVSKYGFKSWRDIFCARQMASFGVLNVAIHKAVEEMRKHDYSSEWQKAIHAMLACGFDRMLDFNSHEVSWITSVEAIGHTFVRYALPITWDYSEAAIPNAVRGGWSMSLSAICKSIETLLQAQEQNTPAPIVIQKSATDLDFDNEFDVILTDPPYYDAIPYSDLMDFFFVWLKRIVRDLGPEYESPMSADLCPKWDNDSNCGELIDDASRHGGNEKQSKQAYEDGMALAFTKFSKALKPNGRLVIVFAHKRPDAWETLVAAIIRSGFVVDGSWPIQTEQAARMRAQSSAALASSVWLVCRKRELAARPGWDNRVLEDMERNITERLREYWDAGIRGPDFVWAATGPAMEAYSKHPVVKKANAPGEIMTVGEFLGHVRRMVVDFVVGQVLTGESEASSDMAAADRMDAPTAYYLLHRNDFGFDDAPSGACILYATACGLTDRELDATWNLISHTGGTSSDDDDENQDPDAESDPDSESDSGSKIKLRTWAQRKNRNMGYEAPSGRPIPLIDRIHRLMHLWKAGDVHNVDEYLDDNGLRRQELFKRLVQSLIELSDQGSEERKLLESLSNHIQAKGATPDDRQAKLGFDSDD